jgi:hypothetical protein
MAAAHHFQSESFTATKWSNAEEKTKFANDLMAFIAADFPEKKFKKGFYDRLSHCFGIRPTTAAMDSSLSQVPHPMALLRES